MTFANRAIGNIDLRAKGIDQYGKAHPKPSYDAGLAAHLDHVAHIEQVGEHDGQAGHEILDQPLRSECDGETKDRCACEVGGDRYAYFVEGKTDRAEVKQKNRDTGGERHDGTGFRDSLADRRIHHPLIDMADRIDRKMGGDRQAEGEKHPKRRAQLLEIA